MPMICSFHCIGGHGRCSLLGRVQIGLKGGGIQSPLRPVDAIGGSCRSKFYAEREFMEVSHHPTLIACHCEGRGWKFWGDSNIRTKFWGRSIQLDPAGLLTLEFDDEVFHWSMVSISIYNLILGKVYCGHHGLMHIKGNRELSCKLRFKEQSILERNPHQVHGVIEDSSGKRHATLFGKWDHSIYYTNE